MLPAEVIITPIPAPPHIQKIRPSTSVESNPLPVNPTPVKSTPVNPVPVNSTPVNPVPVKSTSVDSVDPTIDHSDIPIDAPIDTEESIEISQDIHHEENLSDTYIGNIDIENEAIEGNIEGGEFDLNLENQRDEEIYQNNDDVDVFSSNNVKENKNSHKD